MTILKPQKERLNNEKKPKAQGEQQQIERADFFLFHASRKVIIAFRFSATVNLQVLNSVHRNSRASHPRNAALAQMIKRCIEQECTGCSGEQCELCEKDDDQIAFY